MNRQKSFENEKPTLYLVPTPIGNLSEMTPRAIEVLNSVDVIACEDTRTSGQLLKHFGISKRLIAYQNFNEDSSARGILNLLQQGNNVALISDAGYPLKDATSNSWKCEGKGLSVLIMQNAATVTVYFSVTV